MPTAPILLVLSARRPPDLNRQQKKQGHPRHAAMPLWLMQEAVPPEAGRHVWPPQPPPNAQARLLPLGSSGPPSLLLHGRLKRLPPPAVSLQTRPAAPDTPSQRRSAAGPMRGRAQQSSDYRPQSAGVGSHFGPAVQRASHSPLPLFEDRPHCESRALQACSQTPLAPPRCSRAVEIRGGRARPRHSRRTLG